VSQLSLFSAPLPSVDRPAIEGLTYLPDFVSEEEERALEAAIDREPWSHEYQRRRQHYGVAYDDAQHLRVRPLPIWVMPIITRVFARGLFPEPADACLVNEYLPGQGIAPHHDRPDSGPRVASLSLGSSCLMDLVADDERHAILLAPRSLLVLEGEARSRFMHGIAPRKSDRVAGMRIPRARRLSITLRKRP
jgi:alkylated DNA repair dioxygenase AlkB